MEKICKTTQPAAEPATDSICFDGVEYMPEPGFPGFFTRKVD